MPTGIKLFFCFCILCFSINVFSQNRRGPADSRPERKPLINEGIRGVNVVMGEPAESSIVASIITEKNASFYIEYADTMQMSSMKTPMIKSIASEPVEVKIHGLNGNATYYYTIIYRFDGESEFTRTEQSYFSTRKIAGAAFSFALQGDSHPERAGKMFSSALYHRTIQAVSTLHPDFYFMLGDDFSLDRLMNKNELSKGSVESVYQVQRNYWGKMGTNPPLFLVNGNHEQAAKYLLDGSANNAAVYAGNARKKYFPLPSADGFYTGDDSAVEHVGLLKDYYSFEWGNALFVVIDPYWHSSIAVDNQPNNSEPKPRKDPWLITVGDEQYYWLKNTLEKSHAKYKFVFAHHVMGTGRGGIERASFFEWGGYSQNGEYDFKKYRPNWELPIHQLMVKNKVTIFFQGHDHIFAKQALDGLIYQTVPNPADDTETAFNKEAYRSGVILPNAGFLNVKVSANEVKVEYVRSYLPLGGLTNPPESYTYSIK